MASAEIIGPVIYTIPTFFPDPSLENPTDEAPILNAMTKVKKLPNPHQSHLWFDIGLFIPA
jgi:hypothetical protein